MGFSQPINFHELLTVELQHQQNEDNLRQKLNPKISNWRDEDLKRIVVIPRAKEGFGFVLRGAKKMPADVTFEPTPLVPSLQFFDQIDSNGMASKAGLKPGDFLLEVNGIDVRRWNHDDVVKLINVCTEIITIKVVTVIEDDENLSVNNDTEDLVTKSCYETTTLPNQKRCSTISAANRSNFRDDYSRHVEQAHEETTNLLPASFKDPRCKVASVRSRTCPRQANGRNNDPRISAAELEILMTTTTAAKQPTQETIANLHKSSETETPSTPAATPLVKPIPSPKVYANVHEMKRSCSSSNSSLSSSSHPVVSPQIRHFASNNNNTPQNFNPTNINNRPTAPSNISPSLALKSFTSIEEEENENAAVSTECLERKSTNYCITTSTTSTPTSTRKISLRPKTPPPPPPVQNRSKSIDSDGLEIKSRKFMYD